jgi:thiosulfate dehydrogenase [quinone] large subunit
MTLTPNRHHSPVVTDTGTTTRPEVGVGAGRALAVLRIAFGLTFFWAFVDKVFGLGYATPSGKGWLDGGNPTAGFLKGAEGPFAGFYHSLVGDFWVTPLFMLGLAGIGLALILGVALRFAAVAGVVLYLMMWSAALPPTTNPVIDDHILGAITLVALALLAAGRTWGLAQRWNALPAVRRYPWLR